MQTDWISVLVEVLTVVLAAAAILYSMHGLKQQLRLSTFLEFTRRYSEIMDPLPFDARIPDSPYDLAKVPAEEREQVLRVVRKYANLCSEEFHLHQKKKIDGDTWEIWRLGMQDTMRLPCFRDGWRQIRAEYDLYGDFRRMVDGFYA